MDGRSLHCWKLNLGEPAGFLELVGPANGGAVSRTRSAGPFTLRFDGFELEVPDDFDEDVLQRLLRVVVRC